MFTPDAVPGALYFAWRSIDGTWTQEIVARPDDPVWGEDATKFGVIDIAWSAANQPVLLIRRVYQVGLDVYIRAYLAERDSAGVWSVRIPFTGTNTNNGNTWMGKPWQSAPGKFMAFAADAPSSSQYMYYLLTYDNGEISM